MKNHNLQIIFLIIAISAAALFFSTSKNHNIDERTLVHAIGVDYDKDTKSYDVTLQIFKPQGSGSDTPIDPTQSNIEVVQANGKTISDALNKCQYENGRELFMGHLQIIAFGDTVDFSNPEELLSFALNDKNIFLGVKLCLADKTANELMHTEITRGAMTAENFIQAIEMNADNGMTVRCCLLDFLSCINTHQYIAMPVLSVKEEKQSDSSSQGGGGQQESGGVGNDPQIQIKETAMIKNGKVLPDRLTNEEAMGLSWLTKETKQSKIFVEDNGEKISANLTRDRIKVKLTNENGKIIYNADITVVAHPSKNITSKDEKQRFSELVEKKLKSYCGKAEKKALTDNKTDLFGIWKRLRHSYPKGYMEYKDNLNEIYNAVEFNVNFKCYVA